MTLTLSALSRRTSIARVAMGSFFFNHGLCFFLLFDQGSHRESSGGKTGSTSHLFGLTHPTMIRCSDAAIARGSKLPNQPSDGLASTRVAPGLACMRTGRAFISHRAGRCKARI